MKRLTLLALTGMTALAMTSCSSQAPAPQDKVATLNTGSASAAAPTSASPGGQDAERPRERLDMTNDEVNELYQAFDRCLSEHGAGRSQANGQANGPMKAQPITPEVEARAKAACLSKDPLPPWELDASNPHATDFVHAVVQCLRGKGVRYVDEEGAEDGRYVYSFGGANNDSESISKGMEFAPQCEKDVAARGIGR